MLSALAFCCTAACKALSISFSFPALRMIISRPRRCIAIFDNSMLSCMRPGLFGLTRRAIRVMPGKISCKSSSRLATSSTPIKVAPVTLPPGRPRLATKPAHGVGGCGEDYWRGRCRGHRGSDRDVARTGADNCNFALNQVACHGGETIKLAFGPTVFDPNISAFDEARFV